MCLSQPAVGAGSSRHHTVTAHCTACIASSAAVSYKPTTCIAVDVSIYICMHILSKPAHPQHVGSCQLGALQRRPCMCIVLSGVLGGAPASKGLSALIPHRATEILRCSYCLLASPRKIACCHEGVLLLCTCKPCQLSNVYLSACPLPRPAVAQSCPHRL